MKKSLKDASLASLGLVFIYFRAEFEMPKYTSSDVSLWIWSNYGANLEQLLYRKGDAFRIIVATIVAVASICLEY